MWRTLQISWPKLTSGPDFEHGYDCIGPGLRQEVASWGAMGGVNVGRSPATITLQACKHAACTGLALTGARAWAVHMR